MRPSGPACDCALRGLPLSPTPRWPVTLRLLHHFLSPFRAMTALLDRIVSVIAGFQSREASHRGSGGAGHQIILVISW